MVERSAPLTPEAEAALRQVEAQHRRRHQWMALFFSVAVSVHTTIILYTLWDRWPLAMRDVAPLAFLVVNALSGLSLSAWSLGWLCTAEAMERQRALDRVHWQAERRTWHQHREARHGPPEDASPR